MLYFTGEPGIGLIMWLICPKIPHLPASQHWGSDCCSEFNFKNIRNYCIKSAQMHDYVSDKLNNLANSDLNRIPQQLQSVQQEATKSTRCPAWQLRPSAFGLLLRMRHLHPLQQWRLASWHPSWWSSAFGCDRPLEVLRWRTQEADVEDCCGYADSCPPRTQDANGASDHWPGRWCCLCYVGFAGLNI